MNLRSASSAGPPASSRRRSWVGTSEVYAAPERVAASANASARKPSRRSITAAGAPARAERSSTCSPATWWAGSASSHRPGGPTRAYVASAEARSASAGSRTAFGAPVEPVVVTTAATASSTGASRSAVGAGSPGPVASTAGPSPSSAARAAAPRRVAASGLPSVGTVSTARTDLG